MNVVRVTFFLNALSDVPPPLNLLRFDAVPVEQKETDDEAQQVRGRTDYRDLEVAGV